VVCDASRPVVVASMAEVLAMDSEADHGRGDPNVYQSSSLGGAVESGGGWQALLLLGGTPLCTVVTVFSRVGVASSMS
jgi:hypothetical protein